MEGSGIKHEAKRFDNLSLNDKIELFREYKAQYLQKEIRLDDLLAITDSIQRDFYKISNPDASESYDELYVANVTEDGSPYTEFIKPISTEQTAQQVHLTDLNRLLARLRRNLSTQTVELARARAANPELSDDELRELMADLTSAAIGNLNSQSLLQ